MSLHKGPVYTTYWTAAGNIKVKYKLISTIILHLYELDHSLSEFFFLNGCILA